MNSHSLSTLAIFAFVILGTVCLELRREAISRDEAAREDTFWELTYDAHFDAVGRDGESQLRLAVPFDTRHCKVDREHEAASAADPNLRSKTTRPYAGTGNRLLVFSTRQGGGEAFDAQATFLLRLSPRVDERHNALASLPSRERFLRAEVDLPTTEPAVKAIAKLAPADAQTDFERLQWAFEYCSAIDSAGETPTDDAKAALTTKLGSATGRARAMTTLCRTLGLPARLVTGFIIRQGTDIAPHVWVEVFQNQQWAPFDPTNGYSLTLPMDYVPVRRDADVPYSFRNVSGLKVKYSIKRLPPDPLVTQSCYAFFFGNRMMKVVPFPTSD
jgi:transglutaminase-like putative cysteine protease